MTKDKFLVLLQSRLSGLPQDDVQERMSFYAEMIEDRIEEGFAEEEAVSAVGSVDEIVAQVIADIPLAKIAKERIKSRHHLKAWEIVLLVLGSPIWLSLVIAAVAVILSLYIALWSVIISLWAVFGSLVGCSFGGLLAGVVVACNGNALSGFAMIFAGLVCAGLSIFMFFGCKAVTTGTLILTKKIAVWIKSYFIRKVEAL